MTTKTFTLDSADGAVQILITATAATGGVSFDLEVAKGDADMLGFYLDIGGDGGDIFAINSCNGKGKGNDANNMNGTDDQGVRIGGFDYAAAIGDAGLGNGDTRSASVTINGISFADLDNAIVGVRATSATSDEFGGREGSLKLTGRIDPVELGGPNDFFPVWPQDISNIVLYWGADHVADNADRNNDGFYTVKIDSVTGAPADLDDWIQDVLGYLTDEDDNIDAIAAEKMHGVAIKGGTGETQFFSYGANNTNGTEANLVPGGTLIEGNQLDKTFEYGDIFGSSITMI